MVKIKFDFEVEINPEDINDLMVTALEGGINYWCNEATIKDIPKGMEENIIYASDAIGYGGTLILFDYESDEKHELNQEKFLRGVKMAMEHFDYGSFEDLFDNHDAETADCIVQFALFGEIVFG